MRRSVYLHPAWSRCAYLDTIPPLRSLRLNIAVDDDGKSFWVLRIKVRDKIVADGIHDPDFRWNEKATTWVPQEMNNMLEDPHHRDRYAQPL